MALSNSRYNRLQEAELGDGNSRYHHAHSPALVPPPSPGFDQSSDGSDWGYNLGPENPKNVPRVVENPFKPAGNVPPTHRRTNPSAWKQLWQPVTMMAGLIALGTVTAIAHHFAYSYLNGKHISVFPQLWARNLGSAAAFLVKASFTIATGVAFQEVLWLSLRRRLTKIGSIDKLFSVQSNPLNFLTADGFKTAPTAMLLAAIAWTIPLAAIITPGTLGVDVLTTKRSSACTVPTFAGGDPKTHFYKTGIDDWNGTSPDLQKVAAQVIPTGQLLTFPSPCGSNCSFTVDFFAPALQCIDKENPSSLTDSRMWTYYTAEVANDDGDTDTPPFWIQISYNNYYASNQSVRDTGSQDSLSRTLVCTAYNATYDLNVVYTNDVPTFSPVIKSYHESVSSIHAAWKVKLLCGDRDCPDVNFSTLVSGLFDFLAGSVSKTQNDHVDYGSQIQNTPLVAAGDDWLVERDLAAGIPQMMMNLTVSTLSFSTSRTASTCTANLVDSAYIYSPLWLLMPYAVALALALIALGIGLSAIHSTGIATGSTFSQILVTTRNPALDELAAGAGLSSRDSEWVKEQRIRLGELRSEQETGAQRSIDAEIGSGRAAFGVQGQTLRLRKGVSYH